MAKKTDKPATKKQKNPGFEVTGVATVTPALFVKGMTEEQAIAYLKERIEEHKNNVGPKKPWKEEELLIRHQLIISWLGQGIPTMELARMMMNIWGIGDTTAFKYLQETMKYLTESTEEYKENMRAVQVAKLERLIEECRLCGKYMELSKLQDQLNKLLGLYQDKKMEVVTEGPIKISFE